MKLEEQMSADHHTNPISRRRFFKTAMAGIGVSFFSSDLSAISLSMDAPSFGAFQPSAAKPSSLVPYTSADLTRMANRWAFNLPWPNGDHGGAFPTFESAKDETYDSKTGKLLSSRVMFGVVVFAPAVFDRVKIPGAELKAVLKDFNGADIVSLARAVNRLAVHDGYSGGLPTYYAGSNIYEALFLKPGVAVQLDIRQSTVNKKWASSWGDRRKDDFDTVNFDSMQRSVGRAITNTACADQQYLIGFPTFERASYLNWKDCNGNEYQGRIPVFGSTAILSGNATRQDIAAEVLGIGPPRGTPVQIDPGTMLIPAEG